MRADYRTAMAAGRDAANKAMRAGRRSRWDESDWDVMAATVARIMVAA